MRGERLTRWVMIMTTDLNTAIAAAIITGILFVAVAVTAVFAFWIKAKPTRDLVKLNGEIMGREQ